MKKITLLIVLFIAGFAVQAQSSFTGTSTGDPIYNTPISERTVVVITHSNTQTINPGDEIACANATNFVNNSVFRDFDLTNDFGITTDFEVTSVDIPFGPVSTPTGFPVTVNIYSMTTPFPGTWPGSATLEGTTVYNATNADAQSLVNVPVSAIIPAGSHAIYELVLVDDGTGTNLMRFGCNLDGQTGPFYIMADGCGAPVPADLEVAFGLPNSIVMNMIGDDGLGISNNLLSQISIFPNPAKDVLNIKVPSTVEVQNATLYDILGKNTGVRLVNGAMNTAELSRGIYILDLKTSAGTLTEKIIKN